MRPLPRPSRRTILRAAAGIVAAAAPSELVSAAVSARIIEVIPDLDRIHKWDNSNGDTWDPFWADDGNLYAFNCDGRGFGAAPRNLAFNRLAGDTLDTLAGSLVNPMDAYGKTGLKGADNATWKACGQESIDSVFYTFVSRNVYGKESGDYWLRQTAFNSSLIKSTGRGVTWTRGAAENYNDPMWPGPAFGAPFFVHYGQNGGRVKQDAADRYVYAVSTNGFWNDGDHYVIGRVPRARIAALRASDWSYFTGGDGGNAAHWSPRLTDAAPILSLPLRCGQSPPCYVAALGVYLMVAWYNTAKMTKWFEPNEMRYDFYQAPHPWGPWAAITSFSDRFLGDGHMYGPSLCAKFQMRSGADVKMVMFTSGCPFDDVPSGLYKAWAIPLILKTAPRLETSPVASGDARIVYTGKWAETSQGRHEGAIRVSGAAGDSATFPFTGAGIDYVADKDAAFGSVDVELDGRVARTARLEIKNLPRLCGVTVFRSGPLRRGPHTIRIVCKSDAPVTVDGFRVYV